MIAKCATKTILLYKRRLEQSVQCATRTILGYRRQNHQILCKCINSYHAIAVRSSKLFFYFIPGVNGLAGVGCYLHTGN
jgi:hypothetical protein